MIAKRNLTAVFKADIHKRVISVILIIIVVSVCVSLANPR